MGERAFGPSSKGPRKVPSIGAYDRLAESLGKCSKTGRIRLRPGIQARGEELLVEKFRAFKQSAITQRIAVREDMPRKYVDAKGRTCWSPIAPVDQRYTGHTRGRLDTSGCPDDAYDRPLPSAKYHAALKCTCSQGKTSHTGMMTSEGALTKSIVDRRGCPMHDASKRPMFRRLVCRCGTSFVPQGRFQDTCKACWEIGESKAARIFGPAAQDE